MNVVLPRNVRGVARGLMMLQTLREEHDEVRSLPGRIRAGVGCGEFGPCWPGLRRG